MRLKAMAAERRATIATKIQTKRHAKTRNMKSAISPCQQRAGKRKRQRKHRMLELDHVERKPQPFPEQAHYRNVTILGDPLPSVARQE